MKPNKIKSRKITNILSAFGIIFFLLFIGTLFAVKISFGSEFTGFVDILSFIGLIIMMGLLSFPLLALFYLISSMLGLDLNDDVYELGWHDAERHFLSKINHKTNLK